MDDDGPSAHFRNRFPAGADGPAYEEDGDLDDAQRRAETVFEGRDEEREREDMEREGLYAILNLPTTATSNQIRDRYRQLAMLYHPDKQSTSTPSVPLTPSESASRKAAAETHFTAIQHAYEVLISPTKRPIYDHFGLAGLSSNWTVAPPKAFKTQEQMRAFYSSMAYEKRKLRVENMVKSRGEQSVSFDMRAVFLPRGFFSDPDKLSHDPWSRLQRTRVGQIMMKHSFETPLTEKTQLVWAGQMLARGGAGGGNVVGTIKHQFSPRVWAEVGSSLLNPRIGTLKATYAHDQDTFITANAVQATLKAPPAVAVTFGRKVFARTTAFVTAKSGFWELGPWGRGLATTLGRNDKPALTVGLTSIGHGGSGWTVEGTGGFVDNHVSVDYSMKVLGGLKIKVGSAVGTTTGISTFVNTERQVTDTTKMGMGLSASLPGGITFKFRLWRLGQKITIPVLLSQNINPSVLFFSTVLPATSIVAMHYLYITPRKRRQTQDKVNELQEEHRDYLEQKKAEAMDAVALMEEHVQRKLEQERASDGLIIVAAHYGWTECFTPTGWREDDKIADVTVPIQALVSSGHLHIPGGRPKFNLLGFYDPCMGQPKTLRVTYVFRGRMHEVAVDDMAALRAPVRAHAIEDARNGTWEL